MKRKRSRKTRNSGKFLGSEKRKRKLVHLGDCPSETLFQVDPEDGALYLVKSFDFNANYVNHYLERSCVYTPKVCVPAGCQDAALTTTIRLQNVNDHAPVINSLDKTVTIDEGGRGAKIILIIQNVDNN